MFIAFFCFIAWLVYVKYLSDSSVQYVGNKQCGNFCCFDQNYHPGGMTFPVLMITYLVAVSFELRMI